MDLRHALYELAAQHQLSPSAEARLLELAELDREPEGLQRTVPLGIALLAAALGGLGIIFWIAANWDSLPRAGRFALLQGFIGVMCMGALWRPAARLPLSVLVLLAVGALFAFFGQTYQTGADPWQLFALWAALTLPLCLGVRHDALWAPWALVAMTCVTLWIHANSGHSWRFEQVDLPVHLTGWAAALAITFALSPALRRYTGSGVWGVRVALTFAVLIVTTTACIGLFASSVAPHYWLGLAMMGGAAAVFAAPRLHDTFALSVIGLGGNILLVAGLSRLLFKDHRGETIFPLLVLGLSAAGLLAGTVKFVVALARKHEAEVQA